MKSPGKPSSGSIVFVQEDPTTVQRSRKWAPKTKTGCKTCRIRRVKCDEGRPSCKKCITTGRTCDGYETATAAPAAGSPPSMSTDQLMRLLDQPAHASGPIYGGSSRAEKDAFFRFYNLTVKQVAGKTDTMFWKINLPQLSQAQPVLWHASLALSAMQLRDTIHDKTALAHQTRQDHFKFALSQYSKSIAQLVKLSGKTDMTGQDQEAVLTACIVLSCFCLMQLENRDALIHSLYGLKLTRQWNFAKRATNPKLSESARSTADYLTAMMKYFEGNFMEQATEPPTEEEAASLPPRVMTISRIPIARHQVAEGGECPLTIRLWCVKGQVDLHLRFVEDRQIPKDEFVAQLETVVILAQDIIRDINATSKLDQECTLAATFGAVPFEPQLVQPPIVCSDRGRLQAATVLVTGGAWPSDIGYFDTTVLGSKFERGALVPYGSLVWDDRIAAGGCDCGSDEIRLCHEHATPNIKQDFMREEGIKTIFKDLGEVMRRTPVHMVTMSW
ncbi:hypothetical protein LMH87_003449 [Akanthomyces muscarius]|uniref:Zn(2)-C6 fungal-type domain-containing protein n=1 Tax=Akanthomyces muscarius TaxID=2231603 RepID=A0A9W8UGL7_AKAMU|nr:hypothetical protein LMH87_003449 [Akanthomyces muscarius]KAJ4144568.1 hypothetical protein LMH87_003449 [Akanthomyces muscarius]